MTPLSRRSFLALGAGVVGNVALGRRLEAAARETRPSASARRLKQSVSRWPFEAIPLPDLCRAASEMGLAGIDLLAADDWQVVMDHGLVVTMAYPTRRRDLIARGFNDRRNQALLLQELESTIPIAARRGVPNVIAMFGNRHGRSDAEAIENCIVGLEQIKPLAEEHGVTICLELLNSKVDHADYQGDRTAFGVEVVRALESPRIKLLYDIYHMQIMEGDVIRTIRENIEHIAHFHSGGVPGRHELDDSQELNWRAIATAIAGTGFTGYLAHEFIPTRDPLTSLREAVEECDVPLE